MRSILRNLFSSKPDRHVVSEKVKAELKELAKDKSRTYLMKSAKRADPPNDDWLIIWGCNEFDGIEDFFIENNVANFSSQRTGEMFSTRDPRGNLYTLSVYRLTNDAGKEVDAAICEVSPGVYASGVRVSSSE